MAVWGSKIAQLWKWMFVVVLCVGARLPAAEVRVTGELRSVNGTTEIPIGLFGVHATPLTPELVRDWGIESVRVIERSPKGDPVVPGQSPAVPDGIPMVVECFYDRYQPALQLTDPDWKAKLEKLARTYGANSARLGGVRHVEFWNEPYLNWAAKPGVNYDGAFYDQNDTTPGAPMTLRGQSHPLPSLVWGRQLMAVNGAGRPDYLASSYALPLVWKKELAEGDSYVFRDKTFTMKMLPWGRDPGQTSWFSGPQNSEFYRGMFVPFARALKAADPRVQVVGGWGFHFNQDGWAAWPVLFKPLLDEAAPWLDGLCEHHYGGDTRMVAGNYLTVSAYSRTAHGRDIKFYNTEAGGQLDPEQPGNAAIPVFQPKTDAERLAGSTYMLRDIIHLLDVCPDKAIARAAHEAVSSGVGPAFQLLKDLRGRLLCTKTGLPGVWCVASMRGDRLCAVVFNDTAQPSIVPLVVVAPGDAEIRSGRRMWIKPDLSLGGEPVTVSGGVWRTEQVIPAKSAVCWVFDCTPPSRRPAVVKETEFPAAEILRLVTPDMPVTFSVDIPPHVASSARRAHLRFVQSGWSNGKSLCSVNGTKIPLEVRESYTHETAIDPALLKPHNEMTFSEASAGKGYRIDTVSLVLFE